MKQGYIGSQQHFEDLIDADFENQLQQQKEYEDGIKKEYEDYIKKEYEDSMREELISKFGGLYASPHNEPNKFFINNNTPCKTN